MTGALLEAPVLHLLTWKEHVQTHTHFAAHSPTTARATLTRQHRGPRLSGLCGTVFIQLFTSHTAVPNGPLLTKVRSSHRTHGTRPRKHWLHRTVNCSIHANILTEKDNWCDFMRLMGISKASMHSSFMMQLHEPTPRAPPEGAVEPVPLRTRCG